MFLTVPGGENALQLAREKAHIRGVHAPETGQDDLSAVGMAGEDKVHIPVADALVPDPENGHMGHQQGAAAGVLEIIQKCTFLRIRLAGGEEISRHAVAACAADAQPLPLDFDVFPAVFQHRGPGGGEELRQTGAEILLVHLFVVADGDIDRCQLCKRLKQCPGGFGVLDMPGDQVTGEEDQVRLLAGNHRQKIRIVPAEAGIVQVCQMDDPDGVRQFFVLQLIIRHGQLMAGAIQLYAQQQRQNSDDQGNPTPDLLHPPSPAFSLYSTRRPRKKQPHRKILTVRRKMGYHREKVKLQFVE